MIENAADEGVEVFTFADHVELLDATIRTCGPIRRGLPPVCEALGARLAQVEGIDTAAITAQTDAYLARLAELEPELDDVLAAVPSERRVLVTDHEVFGYFADRYDFEVVGTVIPSTSTDAAPSAADLDALAATDPRRRRAGRSSRETHAAPTIWPTPWPTRSATSRSSSCSPRASGSPDREPRPTST